MTDSGPILITGGAGFIGLNLLDEMIHREIPAVVLDRRIGDRIPERLHRHLLIKWREGDVTDPQAWGPWLEGAKYTVHLAAETSVVESTARPREHVLANVNGILNALEAARQYGAQSFVFASSNAAVGEAGKSIHEELIQRPLSPYGASKLTGEALCHAYAKTYGLRAIALRFSNAYGPHSRHKNSVVSTFLRKIENGESLTVYGDGEQTRDFIHASDLARAILAAVRQGRAGEIYQIATGVETSINRLIELFRQQSGQPIPVDYQPRRQGEILKNVSQIQKAQSDLTWTPAVSIEQGIKEIWNWWFGAGNL